MGFAIAPGYRRATLAREQSRQRRRRQRAEENEIPMLVEEGSGHEAAPTQRRVRADATIMSRNVRVTM